MRPVYLTALALLSGCFNPAAGVQGVWVLYLDAESSTDSSVDCSENFKNGACPSTPDSPDPGPWTYENTYDSSDRIMVGEIIGGEGKDAFLVMGSTIVPGTIKSGVATFSWPQTEETSEARTHEAGYHYQYDEKSVSDTTLTLDIGEETGTISGSSSYTQTWTETDEWDAGEVGVYNGEIPATSYLEEDGESLYNAWDEAQCEADECKLTIEQKSSGSTSFAATRTDYDGMDGSNALQAGSPD